MHSTRDSGQHSNTWLSIPEATEPRVAPHHESGRRSKALVYGGATICPSSVTFQERRPTRHQHLAAEELNSTPSVQPYLSTVHVQCMPQLSSSRLVATSPTRLGWKLGDNRDTGIFFHVQNNDSLLDTIWDTTGRPLTAKAGTTASRKAHHGCGVVSLPTRGEGVCGAPHERRKQHFYPGSRPITPPHHI